ncbi:hypothetical protein [Nitrosococcus wardiae]|uniref:hypothetical protein n=1 Tax=Nitrosococcus wardiae TaxID=1814290 RepID=UPI00141AD70E|nr:hypothetical protein [Nitrosococcus wardiae]
MTARLEVLQRELDGTRRQRRLLIEEESDRVEYEHWAEGERRRLRQPKEGGIFDEAFRRSFFSGSGVGTE